MRIAYGIFLVIALFTVSCVSAPDEVDLELTTDQFTAIMIDVQLAEGMKTQKIISTNNNPDVVDELYAYIFKKHGVTSEAFLESFKYYRSRPGEMELIYEQVLDSLSKLDIEVKQAYANEVQAETDSIQEATKRMRDSIRVNRVQR